MSNVPEIKEIKDTTVRATVSIYNEEYIVKGVASREYIEMVAAYVDKRMHQISKHSPHLSVSKVAVLTALNLADELIKLQEDYDSLIKLIEEGKGK